MTIHTSVFHPYADSAPNADAMGQIDAAVVNDPSATSSVIGFVAKTTGKASYFARFDLQNPTSGVAIPLNGVISVVRAKIAVKVETTAVIDGDAGVMRLAIMADFSGDWRFHAKGFEAASYPTWDDLPRASDAADSIIADRIYHNRFITTIAATELILYTPEAWPAGATIEIGDGYVNGFYSSWLTNFASELESFIESLAYREPALADPVLGITIDTIFNPPAVDENVVIHTSDADGENGMVLTIEWDNLIIDSSIRSRPRTEHRIRSPEASVRHRITAIPETRERIFAASQAAQRIKTARTLASQRVRPDQTKAGGRIRAPESNARSQG